MRIHHNLSEAIVNTLMGIFQDGRYADKAIEYTLKSNPRWGRRDRAFIAENTYGIVRYWRLLTEVHGIIPTDIQGMWKIYWIWLYWNEMPIPDWAEALPDKRKAFARIKELMKTRKFRESVPDWLDEMGEKELEAKWDEELKALNERAPVIIRTNTLQTSRKKLQQRLFNDNNIVSGILEDHPDALQLQKPYNVFQTAAFKEGWLEVQDASSQEVAATLAPEPGMRVIDACAGGGGKTLHLAALMRNKGKIIALDTEEWKLKNLQQRARRAGVSIVETKLVDSSKIIKRLAASADRLLLDVPCSGLGVLRRNPDAKWKLTTEFIEQVKQTQQQILTQYSTMLKPGGIMVYATCSIMPSENTLQIEKFMSGASANFEWISEKKIYASESGFDGFYIAVLKKRT